MKLGVNVMTKPIRSCGRRSGPSRKPGDVAVLARRWCLSAVTAAAVAGMVAPVAVAQAAAPDAAHAPGQPDTATGAYLLGPSDVVEIQVLGQADFTTRAPVNSDGSILLPYIGRVVAANKPTTQLSTEITAALEAGGYYAHPVVSVQIVAFASRYVTVLGNVVTPGLVPIDRRYHLSEILARVGGVRDTGADYLVVRSLEGAERRFLIAELATGDKSSDPLVSPGDKIFSPPAPTFYIAGQVKAPGQYRVDGGMTLRMALGRGGGLTDLGTDHGLKVTHANGTVEHPSLDTKVGPGDVIDVGERLF